MKIGDTVVILKGELLTRVGYAETLESARYKMDIDSMHKYQATTEAVLMKTFPFITYFDANEISNSMAKVYNARILKYGGNQKKIYTTYDMTLDGKVAVITDRFVKHTGNYISGDSECPAYLENRKVHVFYNLRLYDRGHLFPIRLQDEYGFAIESHNLELVREA